MNTHIKLPLILLLLIITGSLIAAACGQPDPIPVYVTPTPAEVAQAVPTQSPAANDTLVNLAPTQSNATPLPSPFVPPGVEYGPITGPNYTPEPLFTPLPPELRARPCPAIITAPQVTLYDRPDPNGQPVGTATERQQLVVSEITAGADGSQWANTASGWVPINTGQAVLGTMRQCEVLLGNEPPTTPFGLHILNWTSQPEIFNLVQRLVDIGHPLGIAKGLTGSEGTLNRIEEISPETITVFRSIIHGFTPGDCPNGDHDPVAEAQVWMEELQRHWNNVNADYYELSNECGASIEFIVNFSIEAMRIANEQGRCVLLLSFPGGNPDVDLFGALLPVYEYALSQQCQPGRYHGIAMHAYSVWTEGRISEKDKWIAFRHRIIYDFLLQNLPEAATKIPVIYTELGQGSGYTIESCEDITIDMVQYAYQIEEDPYVKGFAVWNVGTAQGLPWLDLTDCLPMMSEALVEYYSGS